MTIAKPTLSQLLVSSRPTVSTAKALLALDFQNDFLAEDGKLPVTAPDGFESNLSKLAEAVRQAAGYVIWIRTIFDPTLEHGEALPCASNVTAAAATEEQNVQDVAAEDSEDEFFQNLTFNSGKFGSRPSAKRTVELLRKAAGHGSSKPESAHSEELFLRKQAEPAEQCCLPDSYGSILSPKVASTRREQDIEVIKKGYSAFQTTNLLLSLRLRMVTTLYICGSLSSSSVYATARDAVAHGFHVKIISDCTGYRTRQAHEQALHDLQETIGAELVCSSTLTRHFIDNANSDKIKDPMQEILDRLANITNLSDGKRSQTKKKKRPRPGNPNGHGRRDVPNGGVAANHQEAKPHSDPPEKEAPVNTQTQILQSIALSNQTPPVTATAEKATMPDHGHRWEKTARAKGHAVKVEGDHIAEDSRIEYSAISDFDLDLFAKLKYEIHWQKMFHAQGQVPRLVCTQGTFGSDGSLPVYRHPADQSLPLLRHSPIVKKIKTRVEAIVGHPMNHVLIQLYRNGEDFISEHSDKTLDIVRGSNIVNVSLGAQRTMRLRTKRAFVREERPTDGSARTTQLVPMPHRSVFVLGPKSNERWLHGINHDKRPMTEKTQDEKAFNGERISLTFRQIGTFLNADSTQIWGQGACAKSKETSHAVINGNEEETQRMINAFGYENQQSEFNWDAVYGHGFDVLHFRGAPIEECLLFLSGDYVSDLKVKILLEELKRPYQVAGAKSRDVGSEYHPELCLRDNDNHRTQVFGDIPILLYLNRTATGHFLDGPSSAEAFYQIWTLKEVLAQPVTPDGLQKLEDILTDRDYIAIEFSIADCAYWPIVRDIVQSEEKWHLERFPCIAAYYERLLGRPSVEKVLQSDLDS